MRATGRPPRCTAAPGLLYTPGRTAPRIGAAVNVAADGRAGGAPRWEGVEVQKTMPAVVGVQSG